MEGYPLVPPGKLDEHHRHHLVDVLPGLGVSRFPEFFAESSIELNRSEPSLAASISIWWFWIFSVL